MSAAPVGYSKAMHEADFQPAPQTAPHETRTDASSEERAADAAEHAARAARAQDEADADDDGSDSA